MGEDSKNFAERQGRECETIIVKLEDIKTQKNNIIQAIAREGRHIPDLATYLDGLSQEQAVLEARKVGLDTERNALQAFLSDELRIIENASRVRTYLQSEERSVVMSMIESFVKKVELKNGSVTIHYSIPIPPGGNGKKVGSETLPLNGDQWPMETPSLEERGPRFVLLLAVDDATGTVAGAVFQPKEDTPGLLHADGRCHPSFRNPLGPVWRSARGLQVQRQASAHPPACWSHSVHPGHGRVGHSTGLCPFSRGQGPGETHGGHLPGPVGQRAQTGGSQGHSAGQRRIAGLPAPL